MNTDRRTIVKAAAWSIPVIAFAVATPLAAASEAPASLPNRLRFTNATATEGQYPNTIYANTTVQVTDGPAPVEGATLVVSISRDGESQSRVWAVIAGWGNGGIVKFTFPRIPKGEPVTVTFAAMGKGVAPITTSVKVVCPSWWS